MISRILFTNYAAKAIKKLPQDIKDRIEVGLRRVQTRPFDFVDKLVTHPYYKLRVGEYRLILDIIDSDLVILVLEVRHRKNIYKKFK
jgi:mRNA interferase RelE/StbE